mgnify:CR=1 FL=1
MDKPQDITPVERAKKDWQDLLWNGGDRVENLARECKISLDDMRIMLAADPDAARASFEEDKKAAMDRYETGQRDNAQKDFVRFAEMSRSYKALKNKDTGKSTQVAVAWKNDFGGFNQD